MNSFEIIDSLDVLSVGDRFAICSPTGHVNWAGQIIANETIEFDNGKIIDTLSDFSSSVVNSGYIICKLLD